MEPSDGGLENKEEEGNSVPHKVSTTTGKSNRGKEPKSFLHLKNLTLQPASQIS